MNLKATSIAFLLLFTLLMAVQAQQQSASAAESAEKLRLQLIEVQAKEEALRDRAAQLDEALKPENIERSLAGIGSTKPEELREARRRQLQIERDSVTSQLNILETSHARLEAAIRDADIRAYHQSALQSPPTDQTFVLQSLSDARWLIPGSASVVVAGLVAGFVVRRRLRRK